MHRTSPPAAGGGYAMPGGGPPAQTPSGGYGAATPNLGAAMPTGGYGAASSPGAAVPMGLPSGIRAGMPAGTGAAAWPVAAPPAAAAPPDLVEATLLAYVEDCCMMEKPLNPATVHGILASSTGPLSWNACCKDGLPILHLAAMNEASGAEDLVGVIKVLLAYGASPAQKDEDGDTAMIAVMVLAEDFDRADHHKALHVAVVRTFLQCASQPVGEAEVKAVCSWLSRYIPKCHHAAMLGDLRRRAGEDIVGKAWCCEEFLDYLDRRESDRAGVELERVQHFLSRGAHPGHGQNGATLLSMVVLNAYTSSLEELSKIFMLMLSVAPEVAATRDGFKWTPFKWASNYVDIADQDGLSQPNAAVFLTFVPALVAVLPPEVDAGEHCLKVARDGRCPTKPPRGAFALRFLEGHRVICRIENPGGEMAWEEGVVVGTWYRERCWPASHPGVAYEVSLDIGVRVFAPADHDRFVRCEAAAAAGKNPSVRGGDGSGAAVAAASAPGGGRAAGGEAGEGRGGQRFQKRLSEDAGWQLVDTVSGKARPCSPPDSDEEGG